jgi:hypothetical protein
MGGATWGDRFRRLVRKSDSGPAGLVVAVDGVLAGHRELEALAAECRQLVTGKSEVAPLAA